jgi:hypothetical protein
MKRKILAAASGQGETDAGCLMSTSWMTRELITWLIDERKGEVGLRDGLRVKGGLDGEESANGAASLMTDEKFE